MLRLVQIANTLPISMPCDPSAEFQPGQCAQLTVFGNQVVATVSNGLAPFGLIDDIRTKAFTSNAWDETVIAPVSNPIAGPNNTLVSPVDIKIELINPNIMASSFISIPVPVQLIPRNGVVVFPAGTVLNFDLTGSGTPNAIKTNVRYTYQIPNIIGDDSTAGSNRISIWIFRGLYETDQFETNQSYQVNSNLFCSELGLLTTRQPFPTAPSIALVTAPPNALMSTIQFMWL
jgi:hypothetical protein